ncbi:uncharacterized protein LOC100376483 [Saccoglossus kowalevskii]|uniref:Uncharacterized protein LOC100376483 n=1 Tax=Saccoglossus kowalevskii TaxID=10224 RepID=A0ABM0GV63_SACKO|nr:PREDICTED: uncharacterized protein LOC100376483 [Saccoglossus kowalevskii]
MNCIAMKCAVVLTWVITFLTLTDSAVLRGKILKTKTVTRRQMGDPYAGDVIKVAIVETVMCWPDAEEFCEGEGGMLLKITDTDVEHELEDFLDGDEELIDREFWLGANDMNENGKFVFPDGSDVGYWHGTDIPTKESEGKCVALSPHGGGSFTWEVRPCSEEKSYLCELPMDDDDMDFSSSSVYEPVPDECVNGESPVDCDSNPCDEATCPAYPDAKCSLNNCGGCFAFFFDTYGAILDCGEKSSSEESSETTVSCDKQDCEGIDLCGRETCTVYPDAECIPNECGTCCADWYYDGKLVDCDDACCMPAEKGGCEDSIERYFYNCETKKCETFEWSGCDGNDNNFKTEEECHLECAIWETEAPKPCSRR